MGRGRVVYAGGVSVPNPPSGRRADRRMFVLIAAMVVVWALILVCRNPIRAHWWTHRLAAADDPDQRLLYLQRLVALGPGGATAVEALLNDPDAAIRGLGVALVNHTRPRRARRLLVEMMTDPDLRYDHVLAMRLGMTVDALRRDMSMAEYVDWVAYDKAREALGG